MADLATLRKSILQMSSEEALSLIYTIRADRRRVREEQAKAYAEKKTKKKEPKEVDVSAALNAMDADTLGNLLKLLQTISGGENGAS